MGTHLHLNEGALESLEENNYHRASRSFALPDGYVVTVTKMPEEATFTHPEEPLERPKYGECAEAIASMFGHLMRPMVVEPRFLNAQGARIFVTGSKHEEIEGRRFLVGQVVSESQEGVERGIEAAWAEYRKQLAETAGIFVPQWAEVRSEVQEAFCAAGWLLLEGWVSASRRSDEGIDAAGVIEWFNDRRFRCKFCAGVGCRFCKEIPPEGIRLTPRQEMSVAEWAERSNREIHGAGGVR